MAKSLAEQFKTWKNRLALSEKDIEELVQEGNTFRKYYENYISPEIKEAFSPAVSVNFVYVDMKQDIANKYSKDPKLFFHPENPESELSAELMEHTVNIKWKELKMKDIVREAIQNAKLDGVCAFKTYFNFKKDNIEDDWSGRIKNDDVRTDVVPLACLLKDPDAPSYQKSPWIAHKIHAQRDDIAKRFGIRGEDKDMITVTESTPGSSDLAYEEKGDFQYGTYYEIEDRKNKKLLYIVEGLNGFQERKDFPDENIITMYDFLEYNGIPGRSNPRADYYFWLSHIKEVSAFRSMRFNKALKGSSKTIVRGQRLESWQKDQLTSTEESNYVELFPDQTIEPFVPGQIDQNVFTAEQSARADIQLLSKQAPRQSSIGESKTATEVVAIEQAQQEITSEARDRLDQVLESIANKWVILMQKNYDASRFIRITGMPYADFHALKARFKDVDEDIVQGTDANPFLKINKNVLQGKIHVSIQSGSTAPDNDQTRMQKIMGFVQAVGQLGLTQTLDPKEVIDELIQVFGVESDNLTIQKDNPVEESRLLSAGAFFSPRMNDDHDLHLQIHERENKGSDEEQIHMMIHRIFKRQNDKMKEATQRIALERQSQQPQVSGQSFATDQQGQVGPQSLEQQGQVSPGAPAGNLNGGGLPPQGV